MKQGRLLIAMCAAISMGFFPSCSSDSDKIEDLGEGGITLALTADSEFQSTKALNEADYKNADLYTVQIFKEGSATPLVNETLSEFKAEVEKDEYKRFRLSNGAYTLKAFYGEDKAVSSSSMYVYGEKAFSVNNDYETVEVTCKPQCARVKVVFDAAMATYFSDYSVVFESKALGESTYTWKKDQTDPAYLKVETDESVKATINLVTTAGKSSNVVKSYTLSPAKAKVINVKPVVKSGNVGIEISIDNSTNDIPVDIEIPSDWK